MARQRGKSSTTTQANEAADTNQEAPVSTDTETAPEAVTEAPATEAPAEKAPEAEIDLTAFKAAVDQALASKDETTGDIAVEPLSKVTDEYRKLDGPKPKNAAKKFVTEAMKASMNSMDISTARAYLQISDDALSAGTSGGSSTKAPADPTEAFVQRVATLTVALNLAQVVPEGVDEGWEAKVSALIDESLQPAQEYDAWVKSEADDKGDEPEVSNVVKNAVKLAEGKSARAGSTRSGGSTFTGTRRDIGKHILSAFESVDEGGFLTVAEIVKHQSEEYGSDKPSPGAVSARLFPGNDASKCTLIKDGVQPGTNDKGNKGATKVAAA